jgi:single-stranded DNA-binding protein
MARGLNQVFLIGTLTARPDMRYTPGGLAILDLNLAGQDAFTDESGQEREVPGTTGLGFWAARRRCGGTFWKRASSSS